VRAQERLHPHRRNEFPEPLLAGERAQRQAFPESSIPRHDSERAARPDYERTHVVSAPPLRAQGNLDHHRGPARHMKEDRLRRLNHQVPAAHQSELELGGVRPAVHQRDRRGGLLVFKQPGAFEVDMRS